MKILFYCKDYAPLETGFSIAFRGFCEAISENYADAEITVVTPVAVGDAGAAESTNAARLPVIRLAPAFKENSAQRGNFFRRVKYVASILGNRVVWSRRLSKMFRQGNFDLLFFESADDMVLLGTLPADVLRKVVIRFHSTGDTETARYRKGLVLSLERLLIHYRVAKNVRAILATNKYHLDFIKSFYFQDNPYRLDKCYFGVCPNVINDVVIDDQAGVANDFHDPGKINLVGLGRMDAQGIAQKGFEDLFYAVSICDRAMLENLNIIIVGDGPHRENMHDLVRSLDLQCVRFTGRMNNIDVRKLLTLSEVVVLVSRFEGQSMFAIEGMLSGCAALFTDTGGIADLVTDNGWQVPVQSIDELATALTRISCTPKKSLLEMGMRSRLHAINHFNAKLVAKIGYEHIRNAHLFLKGSGHG